MIDVVILYAAACDFNKLVRAKRLKKRGRRVSVRAGSETAAGRRAGGPGSRAGPVWNRRSYRSAANFSLCLNLRPSTLLHNYRLYSTLHSGFHQILQIGRAHV